MLALLAAPWPAGAADTDAASTHTPLAYFEMRCARCHGTMGEGYGPGFGARLTEDGLTKVVREMAEGPGGAPLEDDALKVQVAFHRALIRKKPFVVVTAAKDGTLSGECTPDAIITAAPDGGTSTAAVAKIQGTRWTLPAAATSLRVAARAGATSASTTLAARPGAHTESDPLR